VPLRLRLLETADLKAVVDIDRQSQPVPWSFDQLKVEFVHGDAVVVGAVDDDDDRLVGFLFLRLIADEVWILNIAAAPDARRRGVGSLLMERAKSVADALGTRLWLEVRESNVGARALYEKHGLAVVGRRPGYYRPAPPQTAAEAAILMTRQSPGDDVR
jgi:ribosomal-protein-alanine N-acetyltransferase